MFDQTMTAAPDAESVLRSARRASGMTIAELSARAGIGTATLWRIETGRATPRRATLVVLGAALGLSAADLAPASPKKSGAGSPADAAQQPTQEGTRNAARHGRPPRPA